MQDETPRQPSGSNGAGSPRFVTGYGQADTHAITLSDGRPNESPAAGKPYETISVAQIAELARNPPSAPKERAQWFIPSSYHEHDARSHKAQRARGAFHWLAADIDEGSPTLEAVSAALDAVAPGVGRIIYSSRGATPGNLKWRALLPLAAPIEGEEYGDTAAAFFDLLEGEGLILDRSLERTAQLVYLPNAGEHYQHEIAQGSRLALGPDHPIARRRDQERARIAEARRQAQADRERRAAARAAKIEAGEISPVDHFNAAHSVEQLLGRYGYEQRGASPHWRSPYQTGRTYGTRVDGDHWVSLSDSDRNAGLGATADNGAQHGDAFDLFVHFEHGGKYEEAVRAYAIEAGLSTPALPTESPLAASGLKDPPRPAADAFAAPPDAPPAQANPFGDVPPAPMELDSAPPAFPLDVLPPVLRAYVEQQSRVMGAPLELAAMGALGALVAACDARASISPGPGWHESPIVWMAGIANASAKKSPVQKAAFRALRHFEEEREERAASRFAQYQLEEQVWRKKFNRYTTALAKGEEDAPEPGPRPEPPAAERLVIQDTTVEGLAKVLEVNPHGLTLVADELSQWLGAMDAYNGGGAKGGASKDRGIWLQAYNGGAYIVDRKATEGSRPSVRVPNFAVSVCGFIQPDALCKALQDLPTDGLLQRFAPFIAGPAPLADADALDKAVSARFHELTERILNTEMSSLVVEPTEEARRAVREWWANEMHPMITAGILAEEIVSHLAKIEGNVWRWAFLFHLVDCAERKIYPSAENVSAETVDRAMRLHDEYLIPAIFHLYEGVLDGSDAMKVRRDVARWILSSKADVFTVRDAVRGVRSFASLPDDRSKLVVLRGLEDAGWVACDPREVRLLPREWAVNPAVHGAFVEVAEAERQRRRALHEDIERRKKGRRKVAA